MKSTPYLVGQLLKVSDELHAFYCEVVRKGDIPPQLAGNSVFIAASETPVKAISVLSQRMQPYLAWAKQYRTKKGKEDGPEARQQCNEVAETTSESGGKKDDSWRARWYCDLYEKIATDLSDMLDCTTKFDDFGRAQVFLGYLAAFPKSEKNKATTQNHQEGEKINV